MSLRSERARRRAIQRRNQRLLLAAAAAVILIVIGFLAVRALSPKNTAENPAATVVNGLQIIDLVVGSGPEAKNGNTLSVHYTGWLQDGTKFDSSVDRNTPFIFVLGQGRVIQGWDQGMVGMKVGGKRKLIIPPNLAYGSAGAGSAIPPNATLTFEVELLAIK